MKQTTRMLSWMIMVLVVLVQSSYAEEIRYEFADSTRSIMRVGPNQSLDMLIQQMYPRYEKLWPKLAQEIRKRNPQAFSDYTGKLIPNSRLKLVTIKKIIQSDVAFLEQVGTVTEVDGDTIAIDKNGKQRRLTGKASVYEGDRLTTGQGAALVVNMIDGAEMRIRQDSSVRITEYTMKSSFEAGSVSVIDLIKGGLRKITGSIGANPLSVYRFHTGVMTIGVRGTDYVVMLCEENDCQKSAGRNDANTNLHVVVLDGLITLEDKDGQTGELIMGQYAVANAEAKAIIDDALPVEGLLSEDEQQQFETLSPPGEDGKRKGFWPWLLGGALLGIGI